MNQVNKIPFVTYPEANHSIILLSVIHIHIGRKKFNTVQLI